MNTHDIEPLLTDEELRRAALSPAEESYLRGGKHVTFLDSLRSVERAVILAERKRILQLFEDRYEKADSMHFKQRDPYHEGVKDAYDAAIYIVEGE